jgi:hypothetical protein
MVILIHTYVLILCDINLYLLTGNPDRRLKYYDPKNKEYYFDRSIGSFRAILYYFQSGGELYRPLNVSFKTFEMELKFYGLSENVLEVYREEEGIMKDDDKPLPKNLLQRKLWLLMEYPESSKQAKIVSIISIFVIVISISTFCMETLPIFKDDDETHLDLAEPFFLTETICIVWFSLEIVARLLTSPSKVRFLTNGMNFIDILAVIPYFANVITIMASGAGEYKHSVSDPIKIF